MNSGPARSLGDFLRSRRTRLDPASFGFLGRRRTPGLRREEVAQRANISPTWYTWLEQGRGGAPSAEVLERIAGALLLTDAEREHLFMVGLGRPPEVRYRSVAGVSSRLQRVLDSLQSSPAIVKTPTWDVVAWNRAAAVVLTDYSQLPVGGRNILRFLFGNPAMRAKQHDWEAVARFAVGAFRADVARAGIASEVGELVAELCGLSTEFEALWHENEVLSHGEGDGVKRLKHPLLGPIELEYSAFAVDGRPDLGMIVYTPVDAGVAARIHQLATAHGAAPVARTDAAMGPA
ncbi:XRE family transcriptional regulator [Xanthomonas sp. GW]|uniref:helix-turn-helix transcriptional regulator n=1 Tax=unclassified Xanthomonas TaxID=2643310 RepID=UPI00163AB33B|nr:MULTISPECIES: helix-turn-helix transcriptional regulator [unclassified Xanthomonas]QNH12151.1 XRE family transcriptional regulator [Xanthomonas sp. SI]QNH16406.1 XRE family transcriptional regulator [Xanthomonas sp. SS]QNH20693.1 XRE family transcriptional regulator [Xanthomonas sp. GW]